jgi:hypothetical protein
MTRLVPIAAVSFGTLSAMVMVTIAMMIMMEPSGKATIHLLGVDQ